MKYSDYQRARDEAWKFLIYAKADSLPVKISKICREAGIQVKSYLPKDDSEGQSLIIDGHPG